MAAKKKGTKKKASKKTAATTPKKKAEPKKKVADIREVSKYALLLTQKINSEDALKKLNVQIKAAEPAVLDYFQRQGIDQIAAGGRTLYLRREVHTNKVKEVAVEQACAKLVEIGLPEYAGQKINTSGLGAYVRELNEAGQELELIQEQFGGAFRVVEIFKIGSRKR
jgi:hypothetical protein